MRLAALFWCYASLDLCVERLSDLRRLNPATPIYVLFGGPRAEAAAFESALAPLADDFFAFTDTDDRAWKWRHGDRMLARWHAERGRALPWDTVFVAQWDLLVRAPLATLCERLAPDELVLPGLRPIEEVRDWWEWTRPGTPKGEEHAAFVARLAAELGRAPRVWGCQFVLCALPRAFLDRYEAMAEPLQGFLEYKIPTLADAWGFGFCRDPRFEARWQGDPAEPLARRWTRTLTAEQHAWVPYWLVRAHLASPRGQRLFHPWVEPWPRDGPQRARRLARSFARSLVDTGRAVSRANARGA